MDGVTVSEAFDVRRMTERTRRICEAMEAKKAIRDFNEATTDYLATPSAANYIRLIKAMDAHQRCKYGL